MTATSIAFLVFGSVVLYGGLITTLLINNKHNKN